MTMHQPPHPGQLVKHDCLDALDLSVTEGAAILGVARPTLSRIVNGRGAISPEMAVRLAKAFGGSARLWLNLQSAWDLARAEAQANTIDVARYRKDTGDASREAL